MKGNWNHTATLVLLAALAFSGNRLGGATAAVPIPPEGDLLEFLDGSLLHGGLTRMDPVAGLRWECPSALKPIDFQPAHIDSIHFARGGSAAMPANCRLRFFNGDDLFGSVASLDNDRLNFTTWFGRDLAVSRASVQSITFLSSNYTILYEGPSDTNGWIFGNHYPGSWSFRDGVFTSGLPGSLGRNFNLTASSTVEFDLAWSDSFELLVVIYGDAVDHLDFRNSSYLLEFTRDQVNLRHIASDAASLTRSLGSAPLPVPPGKNKVRITIQSNQAEGTIAVFADNVLVKRWKDENGFHASGGGLLFQQQIMTGAVIKLSNFKISQWDGRYDPEASIVATNTDTVRFINHDQAAGKITGINDGKVAFTVGKDLLQIPLPRVTQLNFATNPVPPIARHPWEVRAYFLSGGSLSFQLEKWGEKEVSGRSAIFGPIAFQPGQIRELEFNLDRAAPITPADGNRDFEGLDE